MAIRNRLLHSFWIMLRPPARPLLGHAAPARPPLDHAAPARPPASGSCCVRGITLSSLLACGEQRDGYWLGMAIVWVLDIRPPSQTVFDICICLAVVKLILLGLI